MLELKVGSIELAAELALLSALLLAVILSADEVCGLVFVVLFAVKPLVLPSPAAPPPQALSNNIIAAPIMLGSFEELILIMRYYLLHARL